MLAFSFKDLLSSLKNGMLFTAQDVLPCYHECIANVLLLELESVCQNHSLFYRRSLKPFINPAQIYWDA